MFQAGIFQGACLSLSTQTFLDFNLGTFALQFVSYHYEIT